MQSSVKVGRFGLFVVLLGRISTGSSFSALASHCPDCALPLRTTLYHILAVSRLLSSRNLMVPSPTLAADSGKYEVLWLANQATTRGWVYGSWFFRYSFAQIFLDLRH